MRTQDLTHEEKDDLISLTKRALELSCERIATYEGTVSHYAQPETWISKAFLSIKTKGWNNDFINKI